MQNLKDERQSFPFKIDNQEGLLKETAEQFKNWKEGKNRFLFNKRLEIIFPFVPQEGNILDVGCGDFEMLDALRETKNIIPYGVDIMPHDERVIKADCSNLPFQDNFFDCLICAAVIEHILDQKKALLEFKRVLKKGGRLIITTPNPLYSGLSRLGALLGLKYKEGFDNSLSLRKLSSLVKETGFTIEQAGGFLLLPYKNNLGLIERWLKKPIGGYSVLLNQLVVCKKEN